MKLLFTTTLLLLLSSISIAQTTDPNLGIIPAPLSVKMNEGQFILSRETAILFETDDDYPIAKLFHDFVKENYYLDIPLAKNFIKAPQSTVYFSSSAYSGNNSEGYILNINPKQINAFGKEAGLFYALQTLMQLLPLEKAATYQIPCAGITDEPRYKYRGMHLDVGRHMFPVSFIKKYIDLLARYKLNTFHWHLTEDQGWRIEIKKYPSLTRAGAYREQTLIGNYHDRVPQWYDGTRYGGYYTQDEIKEVVAYAALKFVDIIPEIELPGHSMAALAAYPELACGDDLRRFKVGEKWGIIDNVYCAGKDKTFNFLEDVLTEVIALFPGKYIHIGGDECPKAQWKRCKYCQKRIRDRKLKDEHELQSYFIQRIEKFVNSKGRQIIGWDEILEGGLAPNATVMSWRGTEGGIAAAKQNHDVIMTPQNFVYFDHLQGKADQEPLAIGGNTTLQEVYSYNPTPASLTSDQQKRIIGVQANVWTEYMQTPQKVEYMVLPRIYALAEIAWTQPARKNYTNFSEERVTQHLAKLDQTGTLYRVPTAIGVKDTTLLGSQFLIPVKPSVTGAKVYYTINGYAPGETDLVYEKPIQITVPQDEKRILKTIVITPRGKRSAITTTVLNNLAPLAAISTVPTQAGLTYYFVPGNFERTAEIDTARATGKGFTTALNLSKFRSKGRTYGLVFDGYLNALQDGVYTFTTSSDDGSQLLIDGQVIVDNDNKHASFELTSGINLLKGYHKIQVRYFQAGGSGDLKVFMAEPGKSKSEIPAELLFH